VSRRGAAYGVHSDADGAIASCVFGLEQSFVSEEQGLQKKGPGLYAARAVQYKLYDKVMAFFWNYCRSFRSIHGFLPTEVTNMHASGTLARFTFPRCCTGKKRRRITAFTGCAAALLGLFFSLAAVCPLQAQEPIRIGSVFAKTGAGAEENSPNYRIVMLAARQINATGGLLGRPVEVLEFDTKSSPLGARQAALDAVSAKVAAVIGPSWSSQAMAMGPVLQEAGIPMIGPTTTAAEVTGIGDFIFRACYTDDLQAEALARFAFDDLLARRVVVVTIAGDVYSEGLSSVFSQRFAARGGTVEKQLRYLQNAMNFEEQVRVIGKTSPDLVFVVGYTRDSGLLLKQARNFGLGMPFLGGDGWTALEHYPYLDPANGENYYVSHWHPDSDSEASRAFVALLLEEFGPEALEMIDAGNANAFDAVGLVANAVRRAGSADPAAIRDALAETENYPGVTGSITFKDSRDPHKPLVVLRITPDKVEFVKKVVPGQ
jgi:branched-chain amino acid transport system substrate-binding protein